MKWRIWKIESAGSNIDLIYVSTMNYPIIQSLRTISNLTLELDSKIEYTTHWHPVNCSRKRKYDVSEKWECWIKYWSYICINYELPNDSISSYYLKRLEINFIKQLIDTLLIVVEKDKMTHLKNWECWIKYWSYICIKYELPNDSISSYYLEPYTWY